MSVRPSAGTSVRNSSGGSFRGVRAGRVWVRALLGVAAALVACATFVALVATRPEAIRVERDEPILTVRAVTLAMVRAPRVWTGYGTVRSMNASDVSAEVAARVIDRPSSVEPGMPVRRGDVLLRLDPSDYEHALASAEARLGALVAQHGGLDSSEARWREQSAIIKEEITIVRAELERALDARSRGAANVADVEIRLTAARRLERESASIGQQLDDIPFRRAALDAQINDARALVESARLNLERTSVRSPIDGVIQSVGFRAGEMVQRGDRVARVVDLSRVEIPLLAPASAASELAPGDEVHASPDAPGADTWSGTIARIAPENDPARRTVTLFAEVTQDPGGTGVLRPGRFVVASVSSASSADRLIVPRRAVEGGRVLVAESDAETPESRRVVSRAVRVLYNLTGRYPEIDPLETQWSVVEGEVGPGDRVIVSNLDSLQAGARVRLGDVSGASGAPGPETPGSPSTSGGGP